MFRQIINDVIFYACGNCTRPSGVSHTILDTALNGRNISSEVETVDMLLRNADEYTDLMFPVVGQSSEVKLMDYNFVSLIEHPGVLLIVKDKSNNEVIGDMLSSLVYVLPVLLVCFVLLLVVALTVWLLVSMLLCRHYCCRRRCFCCS